MKAETRSSPMWPSRPGVYKRNSTIPTTLEKQSAKKTQPDGVDHSLPPDYIEIIHFNSLNSSGFRKRCESWGTHEVELLPSTPADPGRFATVDLGFNWTSEEEKVILAPFEYVASKSGKEVRTLIIKAFNAWFDVTPESLTVICDAVRLLHTSSLLIDDIQDSSLLRRGEPVAHSIFGTAQTINTANYVYFLAATELRKLPNAADALDVFNAEMLNLHRGQGQELFWRDTLTCPSESQYLKMVANKTGGLFRMAVKLLKTEASGRGAAIAAQCNQLVQLLGLVFQIADDYKNLTAEKYTASKGYCDDLTEGKFSFPVIHSLHSNPTDQRLLHILAQKTDNVHIKKHAVEYMESTGSLEYTKRVITVLIQRARDEVRRIDGGRDKSKAMLQLLDKIDLE